MTRDATRDVLAICDDALAVADEERDAFLDEACGDDTSLRAAVESVLGVVTEAGDAMTDDPPRWATSDLTGQTIGGFRIVESIGEGGMGAVFRAERSGEGFTQEVALKLIRGRFASPELVERFNSERAILAQLNHPYIARLIDGGTDDGAPYLVMEYVDGRPIDAYCDAAQLSLTARIELVMKVAVAVHAAHQNLVIHRDLKPSNVLVTADGIPKLLDFGIAKNVASGEPGSTTVYGNPALTPDYASPEQMLDHRATTASDIYSLGVLAYQLLVGERPYRLDRSSPRAVLNAIETVTISRPSQAFADLPDERQRTLAAARCASPERVRRRLTGDLDNVILKALSRDPARRYASVAAFSADLERALKGEPVEARPATLAYRASRFVARNRLAVTLSAGLVVALVAGLVVTSRLYLDAEAARQDAAARFNDVRTLANSMMFDVYDDIAAIPGTVSARRSLATTAQRYLGHLTERPDAPFDVRLEAAQGYSRLAEILSQEAVSEANERVAGGNAYARAAAALAALDEEMPNDVRVLLAWGELDAERARRALFIDNDTDAADGYLDAALERLARAAELAPDDVDVTVARLTAQAVDADRHQWRDDYEGTVAVAERVAAAAEEAAARHADDPRLIRLAGDARRIAGESLYYLDRLEDAVTSYTAAIAHFDAAIATGGPDRRISDELSVAYWSRGNTRFDLGKPADAAEDYAAAIEITEVVVARDPNDLSSARRLAILHGSQAMAFVQTDRVDEGIALMQKTNTWFEAQVRAEPDTPGAHRSLAVSYYVLGDVYRNADDLSSACNWFGRALAKWEAIDDRFGLTEFDAGEPERIRGVLADCR